jgi:8-oxo-dGTP diphosphatase
MRPKTPLVAVDVIIEYQGGIVLIERKNPPFGWALPGGFVDEGEPLERAAVREAKEETSLDVSLVELLYVYGKPTRDSRGHTVSPVFIGIGHGELQATDDAKGSGVFSPEHLPDVMAFDHREIIHDYLVFKRSDLRPIPDPKSPK